MTDKHGLLRDHDNPDTYDDVVRNGHRYDTVFQDDHTYSTNNHRLNGELTDIQEDSRHRDCDETPNNEKQVSPHPIGKANSIAPNLLVIKSYKRRWYLLFVFSMIAIAQASNWNQFGPIAKSMEFAFSWPSTTVPWMLNIGVFAYVMFMIPFAWLMDRKGLRISNLITSGLLCVGSGLRCITMHPPNVTWLFYIAQFLCGSAGPVANAAGPLLSSLWFPPHQRTTATALGTLSIPLGLSLSFIIGPQLVPEPGNSTTNGTSHISSDSITFDDQNNISDITVSEMRSYMHRYMYIDFGFCCTIFLLVLLYFPSFPKSPPSVSAATERTVFKQGIKMLVKNVKFWMIIIPFGVTVATQQCFTALLDDILSPLDVSQTDAGWIGFYATAAFIPSGLLVSRFADVFSHHMKLYLTVLYSISAGFFVWAALIVGNVISYSEATIYTSIICGGLFMGAAYPLFYELCCETTYPVAEGITIGALTLGNTVSGLILLGVQGIPNAANDYSWWGWCLAASMVASLPVFLVLKDKYNRMAVDEGVPTYPPPNVDIEVSSNFPEYSINGATCTSDTKNILQT